jgi:iron(III) transport system permease protein
VAARLGRSLIPSQESLALAAASVILIALILPPLLVVVSDGFGAATSASALLTPTLLTMLFHSISISLAVVSLTLVVGVPLGALTARSEGRWLPAALFLHCLPLLTPPIVTALAISQLLGFFGSQSLASLYSEAGYIVVMTWCFSPVVTLLTWLGAKNTDPAGDEAGRILGGAWRTLRSIVLPQVRPYIALAALLVFAFTITDTSTAAFLRVSSYSSAVFTRLAGFDFSPGEAAAIALPLVSIAMLLWLAEQRLPFHRVQVLSRARKEALVLFAGQLNVGTTLAAAAALLGIAPIATLLVTSWTDLAQLAYAHVGTSLLNTLVYAAMTSTLAALLAVIIGSTMRARPGAIKWAEGIAWLGFFMPSTLMSIAAIRASNVTGFAWAFSSGAMVVVALTSRYAIISLRVQRTAETQLGAAVVETARLAGASFVRRLTQIHFPATARYIAGAWLLVFACCAREVDSVALLYPPGGDTLAVKMLTLEPNGPVGITAAFALTLAFVTAIPAFAGVLLMRARK